MLIGGSGFWLIDIGSLDILPVWVLKEVLFLQQMLFLPRDLNALKWLFVAKAVWIKNK